MQLDDWLELLAGQLLCRQPQFIGAILGDAQPLPSPLSSSSEGGLEAEAVSSAPPAAVVTREADQEVHPRDFQPYAEGASDPSQLMSRLGVCENLLDFFRPARLSKLRFGGSPGHGPTEPDETAVFANASRLMRFLSADPEVFRRRDSSFRWIMARFFGMPLVGVIFSSCSPANLLSPTTLFWGWGYVSGKMTFVRVFIILFSGIP